MGARTEDNRLDLTFVCSQLWPDLKLVVLQERIFQDKNNDATTMRGEKRDRQRREWRIVKCGYGELKTRESIPVLDFSPFIYKYKLPGGFGPNSSLLSIINSMTPIICAIIIVKPI